MREVRKRTISPAPDSSSRSVSAMLLRQTGAVVIAPVCFFGVHSKSSLYVGTLRWFVDETYGRAHDDPLNEVGDGLVDGQREADIQVDVVVYREGANGKKADERAEIYACDDVATSGIDFCVEDGDDYDRDENGDHAVWHHLHHLVLGTIDIGILHEFSFHGWPCGEHDKAINKVGDHSPKGGQCNASVVHCHSG